MCCLVGVCAQPNPAEHPPSQRGTNTWHLAVCGTIERRGDHQPLVKLSRALIVDTSCDVRRAVGLLSYMPCSIELARAVEGVHGHRIVALGLCGFNPVVLFVFAARHTFGFTKLVANYYTRMPQHIEETPAGKCTSRCRGGSPELTFIVASAQPCCQCVCDMAGRVLVGGAL